MITTEHWRGGKAQKLPPGLQTHQTRISNHKVFFLQGYFGYYWAEEEVKRYFFCPKGPQKALAEGPKLLVYHEYTIVTKIFIRPDVVRAIFLK